MNDSNGAPASRILIIDNNQAIHEDFRKIFDASGAASAPSAAELALFDDAAGNVDKPTFQLDAAYQGQGGLALVQQALEQRRPYAMAFVDVRMPPGWDGIETTAEIWQHDPDIQMVICTAYSDYSWTEMLAKLGRSDHFVILKKPFDTVEVLQLASALTEKWRLARSSKKHLQELEHVVAEQRRLAEVEHVLLEQTLHGSIKALTDVLALAHPLAFGRAKRVKKLVSELAERTGMRERWQVEVAAMLSQLGGISLPVETVEMIYYGQPLDLEETQAIIVADGIAAQVLDNIPRLEVVREMLNQMRGSRSTVDLPLGPQRVLADIGGSLLRAATEFDILEAQGHSASVAIAAMRAQPGRHSPEILKALTEARGQHGSADEIRELPLGSVRAGMVFAEDVKLATGVMLVPRGFEATESLVERVRTQRVGVIKGLVRVIVNPAAAAPGNLP